MSALLERGAEVGLASADRDPVAVYLASLGSSKSQRTMAAALATIAAELGAESAHVIPWQDLRYQHVAALRARLVKRLAPATVNKLLSALRGVAREAMRLGLLRPEEHARIADVAGVRGSRLPAGRNVEDPELAALLEACRTSTAAGARDAALVAVLAVGGLRRAELAALLLADLDRTTWSLRVLGKGDQERLAYVAEARPELEAWLAARGEKPGPLFSAVTRAGLSSGRPLGESSIAYVLQRLAQRAGVRSLSPHDLRRTWVGRLLDAGGDLASVQKLAGHRQVTTTERYDRRPERARQRTAALVSLPRPKEAR